MCAYLNAVTRLDAPVRLETIWQAHPCARILLSCRLTTPLMGVAGDGGIIPALLALRPPVSAYCRH